MMMRTRKKIFKGGAHEKGMILAVATMVVVVMLIMAVPFLFKLSAQYRTTEKGFKSSSAFDLAEAGVDRALWEMNRPFVFDGGLVWNEAQQGSETIPNFAASDGTVIGDISILVGPPSGGTPDTRFIEATGLIRFIGDRTVNRVVRVNLEKYFKSIWDFGFFADTDVYVRTNILIDSFNSKNGAYGLNNRGNEGHIGTNGTQDNAFDINQGSSSAIYGNVASGVGSDPDNMANIINLPSDSVFMSYSPNTVPVGERSIMTSTFEMPSVDVANLPPRTMFNTTYDFSTWFTSDPDPSAPLSSSLIVGDKNKGTYAPGQGNYTLTASNSGVYTSINLARSNVTVSGNVAIYVTGLDGATGSFNMTNNSSITIAPNSSLTLILGKTTYYQANNTSINNTTTASNLMILGTDQFTGTMSYKCNSQNKAAIYVPRAEFVVENSNTHIYGAVVCRRFNFPVNINLHFDEALADLNYVKGGIPYWKLTSWQEKAAGGN
jgi:hypothetical protein